MFGYTSDKEYVKLYVDSVLGPGHTVPNFGVINNKDELYKFNLPTQCCIKSTHSSGRVFLRKIGEPVNLKEIETWLDEDFYYGSREKNYRGLSRKIIVEEIAFGDTNLIDYKFMCYRGTVKAIMVYKNRLQGNRQQFFLNNYYDRFSQEIYDEYKFEIPEKTNNFDEMHAAARKIASVFELVRIDFYSNGKNFYVGEITHVHSAGTRIYGYKEPLISSIIFS